MAQPSEIPELATELYELSKEYLRQETVEPMKKLGAYATLGFYGLMQWLFYDALGMESAWWTVAARGATVLFAGIGAGLIAWRMGSE